MAMSHAHFLSPPTDWRIAAAGSSSSALTAPIGDSNVTFAPGNYYGAVNYGARAGSAIQLQPRLGGQITTAVTVRQHQQNVQVVNVPEARKFFVSNVATRLELMGKLNLNSLIEYIEHLEAYRSKNREKIAHFNEFYYSVLNGGKMHDPDQSQTEEQNQVDPVEALNRKIDGMMSAIEQKLEACQLKRMMNNDLESMLNGGATQMGSEGAVKMKIGGEDSEVMEIIDLTYRDDIQVQVDAKVGGSTAKLSDAAVDGDETTSSQQQLQVEEDKAQVFIDDQQRGNGDIRDELISELQNKLRDLELQHCIEEPKTKQEPAEVMDLVPAWTAVPSTGINIKSTEAVATMASVESVHPSSMANDAKLCLGGHELPLPKAFNQLAQVEKNLLIYQLPESIRGQYLNMCWEARFYEQMATAPSTARDQLMRALNL